MTEGFSSGFVAIIGKPNVGKSTILNYLIRRKVAIVSEKPETTRDNIQGILTSKEAQAVFIDTPGIHKPHLLLAKAMVKKAKSSLLDADLLLFVTELTSGLRDDDLLIAGLIKEVKKTSIALINKVDAASKSRVLPVIEELSKLHSFADIIPVSALKGDNMDVLEGKIFEYLPKGEKYYPDDQITDKDEMFRAAEMIREKALSLTREEVPHSIAVKIEKFCHREDKEILDIDATIYVERDSQKGIIVGRKGEMAKKIATLSRIDLQEQFGKQVFLRLCVKVLKNWIKDPLSLKMLGIE
jgi:GTP-binding protein Era